MKSVSELSRFLVVCWLLSAIRHVRGANAVQSTATEPEFAEAIRNVTVPLGREAVLSCVVNNLAEYRVVWLRADDQTILSLQKKVVTHNPRVSVQHESSTWSLHIRQVRESDRGCYMCQINTAPMKKQYGCIEVQVPPDILDESSTSDVTINEGESATLMCKAKGKPQPKITWRREDGERIVLHKSSAASGHHVTKNQSLKSSTASMANDLRQTTEPFQTAAVQQAPAALTPAAPVHAAPVAGKSREVESFHGEVLRLYHVTRKMMGAYMCIASNEVPPAVSKRVSLNVNFQPTVLPTMQLMGAPVGSEVKLVCKIESHPASINYWIKDRNNGNHMILNDKKYTVTETRTGYQSETTLTIHRFDRDDVNWYSCIATNSMGSAEAAIQLYEIKPLTTKPSTRPVAMTTASSAASLSGPTRADPSVHLRKVGDADAIDARHFAQGSTARPDPEDSPSMGSKIRQRESYKMTSRAGSFAYATLWPPLLASSASLLLSVRHHVTW